MHSLLKYALPCPQAAVLKPPGRNAEIREVHPETGRPCEKELLRPDAESFPSDQACHGNRMMRASERSFPDNVIRLIKASHTVYLCYFQRLFPSHGRKNGRNPSGKHRLARSRCACHQNIMGTCGAISSARLAMTWP